MPKYPGPNIGIGGRERGGNILRALCEAFKALLFVACRHCCLHFLASNAAAYFGRPRKAGSQQQFDDGDGDYDDDQLLAKQTC